LDFFVKLINSHFDTDKVESWVKIMGVFYKKMRKQIKAKALSKKKPKRVQKEKKTKFSSEENINLDKPAESSLKRKLVWTDLTI
jgi:hypothetical protein